MYAILFEEKDRAAVMHRARPYAIGANGGSIAVGRYTCIAKPILKIALLACVYLVYNLVVSAFQPVAAAP